MKTIIRKFLIASLAITALTLTACGDDSENNTPIDESVYEGADFYITPPADWETIDQSQFTSEMPENIVVAFRSNIKNEIFVANANVIKRTFQGEINSADLAQKTVDSSRENLVGFVENGRENITIEAGENSLDAVIVNFDAKRFPQDPITRFRQLHVANGNEGFTVTAAYLPTEDESIVNAVNEMLNSFRLK